MKEIKMYESFNGLRFEKKEECAEYEAKHFQIKTKDVEWYDEEFEPLIMTIDNWNKVKFLKFKDCKGDSNFYTDFCTALDSMGKDEDEKFENFCDTGIWEPTLLIWDENKKEWCYFTDILRTFEDFKTFVENCKKICE